MRKLFVIMMALCAITMYAQTKEPETQEFEYDGGIYRGEALNGKPHGMGRIIYYHTSIDPRMEYCGYFKNGKRHGEGVMYWRDGDQYAGSWENGMENGEVSVCMPMVTNMQVIGKMEIPAEKGYAIMLMAKNM